jgi:DNA-binding MarR family transcriptional regulator
MKELARSIDRKKNTITVLVDTLIDHGYVEKMVNPTDRRIRYISLTDRAKAFKPIFKEISEDLIERIYTGITPKEQERLMEILDRIRANLEECSYDQDQDFKGESDE